jgi:hypothetical protein
MTGQHPTIGVCPFPDCTDPVIKDDFPKALMRREAISWLAMSGTRKGGGVHAVELPTYTGRVAHKECIDRAKRGLSGQASLLT